MFKKLFSPDTPQMPFYVLIIQIIYHIYHYLCNILIVNHLSYGGRWRTSTTTNFDLPSLGYRKD